MVRQELLEMLVCPHCRHKVEERDDFLVCTACGLGYPVRDDIPVMLVDEARVPEGFASFEAFAEKFPPASS